MKRTYNKIGSGSGHFCGPSHEDGHACGVLPAVRGGTLKACMIRMSCAGMSPLERFVVGGPSFFGQTVKKTADGKVAALQQQEKIAMT